MVKLKKKEPFVDSKYTLSFTVKLIAVILAAFSCLGTMLFFLLNKRLGQGYYTDISTLSRLQENMGMVLTATCLFQAIVFSLIVLILALWWGHAVAGPMIRYKVALAMLTKRNYCSRISFREGDQLHHLAESLTKIHQNCRQNNERMRGYLKEAQGILQEQGKTALDKNQVTRLNHLYYAMLSLSKGKK